MSAKELEHSKALDRLREECGAQREGWKEMVRERAEQQMRAQLQKFKDEISKEQENRLEVRTTSCLHESDVSQHMRLSHELDWNYDQ